MRKIPCMFEIDPVSHEATDNINPKAMFIFDHPEARPTFKKDGTAVRFDEAGKWWVRRMVKKNKPAPEGFAPVETDPNTGNTFGWEPVENSGFAKAHRVAMRHAEAEGTVFKPGTFEMVGPKINGNPERVGHHTIMVHGAETVTDFPTIAEMAEHMDDMKEFMKPFFEDFKARGIEGVVWWIMDNGEERPAVKMRCKDFFGGW